MAKKKINLQFADAADSEYGSRQLEWVRRQVLKVRFPELKARSYLYWDEEMDEGAETWRYYQKERVGRAKLMDPGATDIPEVTNKVAEFTGQVRHGMVAYKYTLQDIRKARFAGENISADNAEAALQAIELLFEDVAKTGSEADGIYGLWNQPNALTYTIPNGTAASKRWFDPTTKEPIKTPDEILGDLHGIVRYGMVQTKQIEVPNTIILPDEHHDYAMTKRIGDGVGETIIEHFLRTNKIIKRVDKWTGLETAGASSTDTRMICYRNSREAVKFICPMAFKQGLPLQVDTTIKTICEARTGGVQAELPKSIVYADSF